MIERIIRKIHLIQRGVCYAHSSIIIFKKVKPQTAFGAIYCKFNIFILANFCTYVKSTITNNLFHNITHNLFISSLTKRKIRANIKAYYEHLQAEIGNHEENLFHFIGAV